MFKIVNDMVCWIEYFGKDTVKEIPVIDKSTFKECYRKWIQEENQMPEKTQDSEECNIDQQQYKRDMHRARTDGYRIGYHDGNNMGMWLGKRTAWETVIYISNMSPQTLTKIFGPLIKTCKDVFENYTPDNAVDKIRLYKEEE